MPSRLWGLKSLQKFPQPFGRDGVRRHLLELWSESVELPHLHALRRLLWHPAGVRNSILSPWALWVLKFPESLKQNAIHLALNLALHLLTVCPQGVAWLLWAWFPSVKWVEYSLLPGWWWELTETIQAKYTHTKSAWEMRVRDVDTITGYTRSLNMDPRAAWCEAKTSFWSQKEEERTGILRFYPIWKIHLISNISSCIICNWSKNTYLCLGYFED